MWLPPRASRLPEAVPVRNRLVVVFLFALLAGWLGVNLAPSASAHGRSVSYSSWEIDQDRATVSLRIKLLELTRLGPEMLSAESISGGIVPGEPDPLAELFAQDLVLVADTSLCKPAANAQRKSDAPGWVRYEWQVDCPPGAVSRTIQTRLLLDVAPSHMHFARVRMSDDDDRVREKVLTEATPEFRLRQPQDASGDRGSAEEIGSRLVDYLELGIQHILTGWDHLAFVFGLLLLANRFGEVARLVTGFTLAHSLTLALAVQGWIHPRAAAVEAVIAFSVALVAVEKGWLLGERHRAVPVSVLAGLGALGIVSMLGWTSLPILTVGGLLIFTTCYFALASRSRSEWLRICLTFAFGLVHGFGFAGILVEMTLPTDRLVPALVGFNLGVEIGQIGVVLLMWPMLELGKRLLPAAKIRLAGELSAAALCGLGVYWLVERAFPF